MPAAAATANAVQSSTAYNESKTKNVKEVDKK